MKLHGQSPWYQEAPRRGAKSHAIHSFVSYSCPCPCPILFRRKLSAVLVLAGPNAKVRTGTGTGTVKTPERQSLLESPEAAIFWGQTEAVVS